jgi:hypothetical protein
VLGVGRAEAFRSEEDEHAFVLHLLHAYRLRQQWHFASAAGEVRHPAHEGVGVTSWSHDVPEIIGGDNSPDRLPGQDQASRQVAGQCQLVARDIHVAFTRFGGKPQVVELTARKGGQAAYIVFRNDKGRDLMVSDNGYHVVVRIEGFAYDAYTGAQGLPWKVYLDRLGSVLKIHEKVIEALPESTP